ncbi:DUF11 domain-containing protein [Cellulomonas xiejunii]|uniref:DUF11 domain-containing protein n=1 Tax=Cellulomonas xiejunii TaxID=2968083 RepID=UPI001D0E0495|nr:DUF11 domain-containing protein [Cellulomonas xiejunii]MCC2314968.1 DUF11 domain-containing protein [Cellulomonas xiejunii]
MRAQLQVTGMARRWVAALVASALVATMGLVGVLAVAPAAAAAGSLRLDGAPVTVLAGEDARLSFVAGHVDGATDVAYNVGFAVTLPPGATYRPGSSEPATAADPRVTTVRPSAAASTWYEVLTWENVADLVIGGSVPLAFGVDIDEARFPVGSTLPVAATVHGSADERDVPRPVVDATGTAPVISLPTTFASGAGTSHVRVVPLELEKDEDSPETEVLRGVETQSSVWTLTVRTAPAAGTDDVVVVDHLPAALQLLGCESISLPVDCEDALVGTSVVVDPPGLPAGVWTRVEWRLGAVPAGTDVTIRYRAAVGPQELVADGTFTGVSTRHLGAGGAVTNHAAVTGTYQGAVARPAAADVHVTAEHTVEVRDVALVKSTTATGFAEQSDARFALLVRVGEYTDATSVLVTDVLPDGTCPYVEPGTATSGPWPSDCAALPTRDVVGATMTTSVAHGDGTFTSELVLDDVAHDGAVTVEYDVYLRATHHDGTPTSTGDVFTNAAVVTATTSPVPGTPQDGPLAVEDDSSASLAPDLPVLDKRVWANPDRTPLTGVAQCSALAGADWSATSQPVVRLGDLLCFRVEVAAADGVALRDAVVRDFVPVGTEFVEGVVASNPTGVTVRQVVEDGAPAPAWRIGDTVHDGWFLPAGARVAIDVLARVTETSPTQRDVMGNLAKLRARELDGSALALRDEVGFVVAPAVPLALDKTVQRAGSARAEEALVREGDTVTYQVAVTHSGAAVDDTAHPLDSVEVADALPAGFTCDDLVAPAPACAPGATVRIGGSTTTRSLVTWSLDGAALGADGLLTVGETVTLAYDLTVPTPLSVSSQHVNTASVTRYTTPTTDGRPGAAPTAYVPEGALTGGGTPNAPAATDTASVRLPDAGVAKSLVSTGPDETGNGPAQATVGDVVTFQYVATVPAGATLFAGRLTDTLPAGGTFAITGASAQVPAGATVDTTATCTPAATVFCLDTTTGELRFPPVWTNGTADPQEFAVTLTGRVADVTGATHGADLRNTATLTSRDSATDGTDRTRDTDTAEVEVVLPAPAVAKTPLDATGRPVDPLSVGAGQTVTFQLTASNAESRPPAHDTVVVDCLPTGLTLVTPLPAGLTAGTATSPGPCASGRTTVTWAVGTLEEGASAVTSYQAVVDPGSAGGTTYVNTARLTASTLANGANGTGDERVLTASDTGTVRLPVAEGSKVADRDTAVPGETITWTLRTTLPPHANFYDLAVLDTVPAGLAPAVSDSTMTCTYPDTTTWDCGTPTPVAAAGADGTTLAAWVLGDVPADVLPRHVTVTFTSTVASAGGLTAGDAVTNTATLGWFAADATRTVGPTTTYDRTAVIGTDSVAVHEPRVTVGKSVSDTTVEPTQVVTYTVTATAATDAPHGVVAHAVTVVDTVPAGVVPLADDDDAPAATGDVVGGGRWDETARTITWTHAAITPGTPVVRTYDACLADADTLTGDVLTNSVRAEEWASLDPATPGGRTYGPSAAATAVVTPQLPLVDTTKTQVGANPVYVGDEVAFEVRLRNAGGATAATLGVHDELPDGWEYVAGSATVQVPSAPAVALADPVVSGQELTWSLVGGSSLDLAPGATVLLTYRAAPTAAALHATGSAVAHRNTAVAVDVTDLAGGTSYDGGDGSYVGTTGSAVARLHAADLRIAKTHSTWVAGTSTNTWTVTVTNVGPDPAVGVSVADVIGPLPTGVAVVSVAGTGWTCAARGGDLQTGADCTRSGSLASAASASFTVTVSVAADVASGTEVENTATVSARTHDPVPSNDTTTDTATVTTQADLLVTKTGPASVAAGALATWDVTVRNAGPSVSRGSAYAPIVLTDALPAGVSVTSTVPTGATCDEAPDGVLTCLRTSDLAVDGTFTVRVTGRVDAALVAADGPLVNTAEVTPVTSQGPNTRRDEHATSTAITHAEQLGVTKALVGDLVPGQQATYRVTVRNDGPSVARGVVVTDALPTGLTFAGGVTPAAAWNCTGTTSVTCELDADLGVGATASFTFDVTVASSVVGDVENTAVVGSTWQADQDDDTVTSGPRVLADLGITKTHTGTVLRAGEGTTFRITVTNHGPSDAPGPITVTDEVPAGLPVDGTVSADAGTCSVGAALPSGDQPVTCTLPAGLDAGGTWAIDVPVAVPADAPDATHTNTAVVSGPADLDEGDDVQPNTATDTLEVVRRADVAVVKTAGATSVVAGTDVTYTLAVGNAGPSVAAATVVRDVLPATLAPVSATVPGDPDACTVTGQTVRCELGDVAPGATPTVTVVATVRSGVADGSTVVNTATVASTTTDVDGTGPSTDEDDASIATTAAAELSLTKSPASQEVRAGADATFTLVAANDGPSDVTGPVTITDTLPTGTSLVSAATPTGAPAWVCAEPAGQVVTCTLGDGTAGLTAGASAPGLVLVTRVAPDLDPVTLTNSAVASSPLSGDSDPATADVVVTTAADLGVTKSHVATPIAGRSFEWVVTVRNGGPSDSRADADDPIVVVDRLPVGVTFAAGDAVTREGFTCAAGDPVDVGGTEHATVRCERPTTLPAGAEATFHVPVVLDADLLGDVTNTVSVTPGLTPQPADDALPDTATDTVEVTGVADLGLVKSLVTPTEDVVAGLPVQWRVDVTNHGPSTSRADATTPLVVVDTLPAGVRDVTASGAGWACTVDAAEVTCERTTDLLVGAAPAITVDAVVASGTTAALPNTATVTPGSTPQRDPAPMGPEEPDTDDVTVNPATRADLRLDKSVTAEPVAGATGTFRLRVTNLGPSDAVDVVLHDTLPAGLTATGVVTSSGGVTWTCTGTAVVGCTLDGPLPAATSVWVDLEVAADQALTGDVTNTARVGSGTPDPDPTNDESSVTTGTGTLAALTLDKSHTGTVRVGDALTFDLVVANGGPSQARGLTLEDLVPAALDVTGVRSADPAWVCSTGTPGASGTPVLCVRDELDAGTTAAPVHVDVVVTAAAYPGVTNTATVVSATPSVDDPTGARATDDDTLDVPAQVALHLSKTIDGTHLQAGAAATYLLTVSNEGPTADPGPVTITDVLPAGLRLASTDGAPCTAEGRTVTCTVDGLDVGEQATVRVHVLVERDAPAEVTNTATVDSAAEDVAPDGAGTASARADVRAVPLAVTGAESAALALLAAFLLAGGAGAVLTARRGRGRHSV